MAGGIRMQAQDIMRLMPLACNFKQNLAEVAGLFLEQGVDGLPVVNDQGLFVCYIGKNQLYKAISKGVNFQTPVQELMMSNVMTIAPDTELEELYPLSNSVVPVIHKGKLLGVVTREAVATYSNFSQSNLSIQTEALLDAAYEGIIGIDKEQQIIVFNRAAEEILGMERAFVLNRAYLEV